MAVRRSRRKPLTKEESATLDARPPRPIRRPKTIMIVCPLCEKPVAREQFKEHRYGHTRE